MSWLDARHGLGEPPSHYKTAEVCLNGHPTTSDCEGSPNLRSKFCARCGAETVSACPDCKANIRGRYYTPGFISAGGKYQPPNHCHNCGKPLPWTQRSIEAACELADELEELSSEERNTLKASIADLTSDSPKTEVAISRYKRLLKKAGPALLDTFNKIIVGVATEAVKKSLSL